MFVHWLVENRRKITLGLIAWFLFWGSFFVVEPGNRGVVVTLGSVSTNFRHEGLGLKFPIISSVTEITVRQDTKEIVAECYSTDMQQVKAKIKVLYRVPEESVVDIYRHYSGDAFTNLVAPRVQEAFKELTAGSTATDIVHNRELIKTKTLELTRKKIGGTIYVTDVVIENLDLSDQLEKAIEAKMVKQQEQEQAVFVQNKARIDAATALIIATGEANAIKVRGQAIKENPNLVDLMIAERWNGTAPLSVSTTGGGANILLPLEKK